MITDRLMTAKAAQKERINCANDVGLDLSRRCPGIALNRVKRKNK